MLEPTTSQLRALLRAKFIEYIRVFHTVPLHTNVMVNSFEVGVLALNTYSPPATADGIASCIVCVQSYGLNKSPPSFEQFLDHASLCGPDWAATQLIMLDAVVDAVCRRSNDGLLPYLTGQIAAQTLRDA